MCNKESKWHRDVIKEKQRKLAQESIESSVEALEMGMREGTYVFTPPTEEEYKGYYADKLDAYFELWASTWSAKL